MIFILFLLRSLSGTVLSRLFLPEFGKYRDMQVPRQAVFPARRAPSLSVVARHRLQNDREVIMNWVVLKRSLNLGRFLLLTAAIVAPAAARAQSYSITDVGALPGATGTRAWGINDNGTVVGWSGNATMALGYIWTNGVMKSVGSLPGGAPGSLLFAVNGLGQAVGVANPGNTNGLLQYQGILYRNNTMITIDTGSNSLFAHYITDSGVIVGDYLIGGGGSSNGNIPAFWVEDPTKPGRFRRTDLVPVLGDTAAYANAAN